jgi:hypothetical protein
MRVHNKQQGNLGKPVRVVIKLIEMNPFDFKYISERLAEGQTLTLNVSKTRNNIFQQGRAGFRRV